MKRRKFKRQDYFRYKKIGRKDKWRRPRGRHSKQRRCMKGKLKMPKIGYSKGKNVNEIPVITNLNEITNIRGEALISSRIGLKKAKEIIKKAKEMGIKILNAKKIIKKIKKREIEIERKKKKELKEESEKTSRTKKEEKTTEKISEEKSKK